MTGRRARKRSRPGRRYDYEIGLYHNRVRAYSPVFGRFLQADPIGTEGGINLYAYVGNDPLNLVDPTGEAGRLLDYGRGALDSIAGAGARANAFVNGAYSVLPGVASFGEVLMRGTGLMGSEDFYRFNQEADFINNAIVWSFKNPAHLYSAAQIANKTEPLLKYYVAGRATFGFVTGLGPAAFVGDTSKAVQNGHSALDAILQQGAFCRLHQ